MIKHKSNFLLALLISFIILIPDILANYRWDNYASYETNVLFISILFTLALIVLTSYINKTFFIIFVSFLIGMGFFQLLYFDFFYSFLQNYDWSLMSEAEDIFGSLESIYLYVIFILSLLALFLFLLYFFIKALKLRSHPYASSLLFLITLLLASYFYTHQSTFPQKKYFSYMNTTATLFVAILHSITPEKTKKFKHYKVKKTETQKPIVILIMGESLNATKMQLYGSKYGNTPMLEKLKTDKKFQYSLAISGAVNTAVSLPIFFYMKREPLNKNIIPSNKTNILKLAKENGYKTYWLSTQKDKDYKELYPLFEYTDILKTKDDWSTPLYDDVLVNELSQIDFHQKTFLVMHLRVNHSPYENYIPKKYTKFTYQYDDYFKYKLFSYLNSITYVDNIVYSIIEYMKKNEKSFVIYFTADHGEMLGSAKENYKYGHSQLDMNCAKVPFIYYSDIYKKTLNKKEYNHYIISKMLIRDLGYELINPNEDGTYFLNGVELDGAWGYIPYTIKKTRDANESK